MLRKLASYVLLSFLSFSVATTLFHTVANAQTSSPPIITPTGIAQITKPPVIFTLQSIDGPTPTATPIPPATIVAPTELDPLFSKYAAEYNVDKEDLKRIARCEAGFNADAHNGPYAGMYQFAEGTWISTRNAMGLDPNPDLRKNAEEAIRTAAFKISNGGRGAWPNC